MHTTKEDTTIFWMKLNFEFFSLLKFKASESYTCILPPHPYSWQAPEAMVCS